MAFSPTVLAAVDQFIAWAELIVAIFAIYYFIKFLIGPSDGKSSSGDGGEVFKNLMDTMKKKREEKEKREVFEERRGRFASAMDSLKQVKPLIVDLKNILLTYKRRKDKRSTGKTKLDKKRRKLERLLKAVYTDFYKIYKHEKKFDREGHLRNLEAGVQNLWREAQRLEVPAEDGDWSDKSDFYKELERLEKYRKVILAALVKLVNEEKPDPLETYDLGSEAAKVKTHADKKKEKKKGEGKSREEREILLGNLPDKLEESINGSEKVYQEYLAFQGNPISYLRRSMMLRTGPRIAYMEIGDYLAELSTLLKAIMRKERGKNGISSTDYKRFKSWEKYLNGLRGVYNQFVNIANINNFGRPDQHPDDLNRLKEVINSIVTSSQKLSNGLKDFNDEILSYIAEGKK